jgi:hypothetical protein
MTSSQRLHLRLGYTNLYISDINKYTSYWGNMPRLYAPLKQGVCAKSSEILVLPWPPHIKLARTTVELESTTTQTQEGEDDEDITTIDTTTPNGQKEQPQAGHTVRACWLNSQGKFDPSCPNMFLSELDATEFL